MADLPPNGTAEPAAPAATQPVRQTDPAATTEPKPKPSSRERRHNRNGFVALLGALMSLALIGALGLGAALWFGTTLLDRDGPLGQDRIVAIPEGSGTSQIAAILAREGALPDIDVVGPVDEAFLFRTAVRTKGAGSRLRAGEYLVPANVSINGLVDLLTSGQAIQHKVTIPEGLSSWQVVQRLANHEILEGPIPAVPPEGAVRTDTYTFPRGTTRQDILNQMMADQAAIVQRVWANRAPDLPIDSPEELVTLASIVEKETGVGAERAHVASVFHNRLRRGMKLQSDPTIIYGINQGRGSLGRGLRRSEIDQATPYNTYAIPALPPGPIANPGVAALEATANPLTTDDLFFVADGTGGHVFAKTYEEHLRNVAQWRRIEEAQRAAQAEDQRAAQAADEDEAEASPAPDLAVTYDGSAPDGWPVPLPPVRGL